MLQDLQYVNISLSWLLQDQLRARVRCKISYSFAREAVQDHWFPFPGWGGPPEMDHFGTLGTTKHTLSHRTASGHLSCTPSRPKRSIVPTWAPKTLPKWRPKRCQVDKCRHSRNMRRRERIACPPLRFRSFSESEKCL